MELGICLDCVTKTAREAGQMFFSQWRKPKTINEIKRHDIKLQLDVETQQLIQKRLLEAYPDIALLGEEGSHEKAASPFRWVVDPIDGTVNFAFDIPHACVSIALQRQSGSDYETILGVIYDPFCNEIWTATTHDSPRLNGEEIRVSDRSRLNQTVVSVGFSKLQSNLAVSLDAMAKLTSQVRKVRIMGSAALDLAYVACGRLDAYMESGVRLWDIAAGGFILERAGGEFHRIPIPNGEFESYKLAASNGKISDELHTYLGKLFD
ncbi:MAG TPA: inositol monophosphatase family protein [Verrucomicrobiota bacterium]|nr:inositol monophosphatase family protein [Verrucomicrobiota bacterium]